MISEWIDPTQRITTLKYLNIEEGAEFNYELSQSWLLFFSPQESSNTPYFVLLKVKQARVFINGRCEFVCSVDWTRALMDVVNKCSREIGLMYEKRIWNKTSPNLNCCIAFVCFNRTNTNQLWLQELPVWNLKTIYD